MSDLTDRIEQIRRDLRGLLKEGLTSQALQDIKVRFFGKKGDMTQLQKLLGKMTPQERPTAGKIINDAKNELSALLDGDVNYLLSGRNQ